MMNSKKKLIMILVCITLFIGITVIGIAINGSSFSKEENEANSYNINTLLGTNIDKDSQYSDYISKLLAETIKEENGVMDCQVNISFSNGEVISANVNLVAEDDKVNISETDILEYVSKALEISKEDIIVTYDL